MTKFLKVGDYQPQDYTKADYMQYLYLKKRAVVSEVRITSISSVKSNESDALYELFEFHMHQLEQDFKVLDSNAQKRKNDYLQDLRLKMQTEGVDAVIKFLENDVIDNWLNEEPTSDYRAQLIRSFTVRRVAFLDAMYLVSYCKRSDFRDPEELAPTVRSLQYLGRASNHNGMSAEMCQAHESNLNLVNAPDFDKRCEQEFLHDGPIVEAKLAQIAQVPPHPSRPSGLLSPAPAVAATADNAGFFLKVYYHPAFKHWLTQMILAAVVLTAALVTAAFMLNASMLPLAIAGVVKGLSSMAAKTVFGSAVVVGTAATFTLGASLHARFFSEARDGATPPAGAGVAPSVNRR